MSRFLSSVIMQKSVLSTLLIDGEAIHHFKDILKKMEFSVSIMAVRKEEKGYLN